METVCLCVREDSDSIGESKHLHICLNYYVNEYFFHPSIRFKGAAESYQLFRE